MPTCCKSITVTIGSGGCVAGANGTDPTPNTLLVIADVSFGSCTTTIANLGTTSGFVPWSTVSAPVGNYKANYISGNMPFFDPTTNTQGRATGTYAGFNEVGSLFAASSITLAFSGTASMAGFVCAHIPPADCSGPEIAVIVAQTLAINPVMGTFDIDSAQFGRNGGNVANIFGLTEITETVLGAFCPGGGSITWELIQTRHVYEQPLCVQIKDYAAVKAAIGVCVNTADQADYCAFFPANCSVAINEWTGTFPFRRVFYPNAADRQVQFFTINVDLITFTQLQFTLNGQALATSSAGRTSIAYREVAGVGFWELIIMGYVSPVNGSLLMIWYGTKSTGTDPIGEYTYDASQLPCATGPATICIEACP